MTLILTLLKVTNMRLLFVILILGFSLIGPSYAKIGEVSEHDGSGTIQRESGDEVETKKQLEVFSYDEVNRQRFYSN